MNVCLINPRGLTGPYHSLPHGLLSLCTHIKAAGHDCHIIDYCNEDISLDYSKLAKYDVIGLSVMSTQLRHAVEIANAIPRGKPVVWGGAHCLVDPASLVASFPGHFVVSGDGEGPMLRLLDFFEKQQGPEALENELGLCFHGPNGAIINPPNLTEDINNYADIDYFDLPQLEKYIDKKYYFFHKNFPTLRIITSRGCAWKCSFCIHSVARRHQAGYRSKDFSKIRRETEQLVDDFGIRLMFPEDDNFFANMELVQAWADYAAEKGFLWGGNCRFDYLRPGMYDEAALDALVNKGLFLLTMSVEAGLEEIRNGVLEKSLSDDDIRRAAGILQRLGGERPVVHTNFMIDFPGDSFRNRIAIMEWMDYLSKRVNVLFHGPVPYMDFPGTKLYNAGGKRTYGDLDYYLKKVPSLAGFDTPDEYYYRDYFYTDFIRHQFNRKFRFFEAVEDGSGVEYRVTAAPRRGLLSALWETVKSAAFATIRLRLATGFWGAFFEPALSGAAKRILDRLRGKKPPIRNA